MIEIKKYSELANHTKNKLNSYIKNEFGHFPIVIETEWANADWTIINYAGDEITTFYNIIEREIIVDSIKYKIGGISNVITPKEYRGKGFATKTLRETENFMFDNLDCDFGLLLCADDLIPFYERLNWYKVDCPVYFNQADGRKLWKANTMLLTKTEKLNPKEIDLNGLPW